VHTSQRSNLSSGPGHENPLAGRPQPSTSSRSRHKAFYTDLVPSMLSVLLISGLTYYSLEYVRSYLSRERLIEEFETEIRELKEDLMSQLILEDSRRKEIDGAEDKAEKLKKDERSTR
jgi:hypothetical protein